MPFWAVVLASCLSVASAGPSPHADLVEELQKSQPFRYSSNVIADALLDVPELISKYGYPFERHDVTTEDGYVLTMHRIPHGRDRNNVPDPNKPVVFIMHGLLSSSADFIILGPGNALAYLLAEEGYDVWLGNARGNYYSRRHLTISPDDKDFWRFSWDEIGYYDLAAYVDYITSNTGQPKIQYIGHSQGGTAFFVLNSLRPEYNEKFVSFQGLAPASYFIHNNHSVFAVLAPHEKILEALVFRVGLGEFAPNWAASTYLTILTCSDVSPLQNLCHSLPILGGMIQQLNTTMIPLFIGHAPAGASIRQVAHYGQSINSGEFRRFDYGIIGNIATYGRVTPPSYDMSKITTPAYLHYGLSDTLVHHDDIYHLSASLGNFVSVYQAPRPSFTHIDYVWGIDAKEQVYDGLIEVLKATENRV